MTMNVDTGMTGELASLATATAWINSPPLTDASLRGKVVLVDFGTYTCINWIRTLPWRRAWNERYKAHGLVMIGINTPEFSVEKRVENVQWAMKEMRVSWPVAVDNDYSIWRAFDNNYWPALYLVDATGRVRYHHYGEGGYEKTEEMIQRLLSEAGAGSVPTGPVSVDAAGLEAQADWGSLRSPENYLGSRRTENFASPGGIELGVAQTYRVPSKLRLNGWALSGSWTAGPEAILLNEPGGRIVYRFHARDVNLVMGPKVPGTPVRFRVLVDGAAPGAAHGVDVNADGNGVAKEQRMYQLIRQSLPVDDRTIEIEFLDAAVEGFAFTFG